MKQFSKQFHNISNENRQLIFAKMNQFQRNTSKKLLKYMLQRRCSYYQKNTTNNFSTTRIINFSFPQNRYCNFFTWIIKLIQIISIHCFFASLSILLCWSNYVYMSCKWYCITNLSNDKWVSSKNIIESVLRFSCFKIRDPQETCFIRGLFRTSVKYLWWRFLRK